MSLWWMRSTLALLLVLLSVGAWPRSQQLWAYSLLLLLALLLLLLLLQALSFQTM